MRKYFQSFRARIIVLFIESLIISAIITFGLYKILQYYYRTQVYYGEFFMHVRFYIARIGDINVFLILFIPMAILIFYLLTKRYTSYFQQISSGINELANGNFEHQIVLPTNDEFSKIAADLNEASKRLKQAIELENFAESSKDQLIANLAHDLRTPLTSVLGYLHLLQNEAQLTIEQQRDYTHIAYTKAQYLQQLVEELFTISKLDMTLDTMVQEPLQLDQLLLQVVDEMYPIFEEASTDIAAHITPQLFMLGNGRELARVFENLLANAVRYGDASEPITITATAEQTINICIKNASEPISEQDLAHLFDMFYTVDRARTFHQKQTGLGLYIAKAIIEKHQGHIRAQYAAGYIEICIELPNLRKI